MSEWENPENTYIKNNKLCEIAHVVKNWLKIGILAMIS